MIDTPFERYTSKSQFARVSTEAWIADNGYCLGCNSERLLPTRANTEARDFECQECGQAYELKSALRPFGSRIVDGAYASMMRRIESGQVANFLLLRYANPWAVTDIAAIHHSLITPDVIQKRNPLAITARRSGWVGCNILLDGIPPEGRITLMKDGLYLPKSEARRKFGATQALAEQPLKTRNCSRALLNLIRTLPSNRFTLREVYRFERELAALYPRNHNLRPKIRQQLQVLRDAGLLKFEGQGTYELTFAQ